MGSEAGAEDGKPVRDVRVSDFFMMKYEVTVGDFRRFSDAAGYRTEAEWEYAARGGSQSQGYTYAGSNDVNAVAWYTATTDDKGTRPVGGKAANEPGLYDMSGNAREWCWDWYGKYASGSRTDPRGAATGTVRVLRGGGWPIAASLARSTVRRFVAPSGRRSYLGFRLVRPSSP